MCRSGITKESARVEMRRRLTLIGAMMVHLGDAHGMICGTVGAYCNHLQIIDEGIGRRAGANTYAAMNILLLDERTVALADTHVKDYPHAEKIEELTKMAAAVMRQLHIGTKTTLCYISTLNNRTASPTE